MQIWFIYNVFYSAKINFTFVLLILLSKASSLKNARRSSLKTVMNMKSWKYAIALEKAVKLPLSAIQLRFLKSPINFASYGMNATPSNKGSINKSHPIN